MAEDGAACTTCGSTIGTRFYVMNAFHDDAANVENAHRTGPQALPVPRCFNGMNIPANYSQMVSMIEAAAAEQPIRLLEIAAHGTGFPKPLPPPPITRPSHWTSAQWDAYRVKHQMSAAPQYERPAFQAPPGGAPAQDPGTNVGLGPQNPDGTFQDPQTPGAWRRVVAPGAAIIGRTAELVSGRTIHLNEHGHGDLSARLGRAVVPGGRIIWQCCNLGDSMAPHMSFLAAFSARAPGRDVSGASGPTAAGTTGLQGSGTSSAFAGYHHARDGIVSTRRPRADAARDFPWASQVNP